MMHTVILFCHHYGSLVLFLVNLMVLNKVVDLIWSTCLMNEINWVTTLVHILLFLWREGQKCKCISFVLFI